MKIKLMLVAVAITLVSVFMSGCGNETKLGYVDVYKIMTEAPQMKAIKDNFDKKDSELEAKAKDLDSKKGTMSEEDMKKAQMDLQREYNGLKMQYQSQAKNTMDKALAEIVKEKDLSAVVPQDKVASNGVQVEKNKFVIQGGIDITDEVMQKLQ